MSVSVVASPRNKNKRLKTLAFSAVFHSTKLIRDLIRESYGNHEVSRVSLSKALNSGEGAESRMSP